MITWPTFLLKQEVSHDGIPFREKTHFRLFFNLDEFALVPAETNFMYPVNTDDTVFVYILEGQGKFTPEAQELIPPERLILFSTGDQFEVTTHADSVHFLFLCGATLKEPVAWRGPIVMNTNEEIATAFREYHEGIFVKHGEQILHS